MKTILFLTSIAQLVFFSSFGQVITPTSEVFSVGQTIKFSIVHNGSIGVENEIKKLSEQIDVSNFLEYNAGTPSAPGFYRIDFTTSNGNKIKFQILVLPVGFTDGEKTVMKVPSLSNDKTGLFNKFFTLSPVDRNNILQRSVNIYFSQHSVSVGTTFVICIATAPSGPATFAIACGKQVLGNAKDFALVYIEQATIMMVNKHLISELEKQTIIDNFKVGGLVFELISINFNILNGKIVVQNLSETKTENIVTLSTSFISQIASKEVEMGATITSELIKKYDAVIKLKK